MGLRQTKAERTRERAVDAAIDLFAAQGYDGTTMEQIAERAEVGPTTLYRYFASKELLLLDRIVAKIDVRARLREQPDDLPLGVALGRALAALADEFDDEAARLPQLRAVIDVTPGPRARLWDLYAAARADLETEIARRTGQDPSDLAVRMTGGVAFEVVQLVDEERKRTGYARSTSELLDELLRRLPDLDVTLPVAPSA